MGLFFKSPVEEVHAALKGFTFKGGMKEVKFRDELTKHLGNAMPVSPKREAGLHGQGTNVDLYFEHRGENFFITIKQGLDEQKVKVLLGELVIINGSLLYNEHPRDSHVICFIMTDHRVREEAFSGHLETLMRSLLLLNDLPRSQKGKVKLHLGIADAKDGVQLLELSA